MGLTSEALRLDSVDLNYILYVANSPAILAHISAEDNVASVSCLVLA